MEPLLSQLDTLKVKKAALQSEGDVLIGCYICGSKPGGTASAGANLQFHLRSRSPMFDGKKSLYIKTSDLPRYCVAIERGRAVQAIDREMKAVTRKLDRITAIVQK